MSERRKAAQRSLYGGSSVNLDSSEGLYALANQVGLGAEADRALEPYTGESKKFLSGGFVSDAMDVLSSIDYGITGILKGQGFIKGIENRSSFSDDDALGKHGVVGKTAGIVADIALGVATSFIPIAGAAKWASKAAGVTRLASLASKRLVGELKPITLSGGEDVIRVGGIDIINDTLAKFLPNWSYDPQIKKKLLDSDAEAINLQQSAYKLYNDFDKFDTNIVNNIAVRDADGRFIRKNRSDIMRDFKEGEGLEEALQISKGIDDLMDILVNRGGLSKDVAEQQFGKYLTQSYDEIILAKSERPSGSLFRGGNTKGRNYDLTSEKMEEMGQVSDMKLVLPNTMNKIITLIHNTELGNILERQALTMDDLSKITQAGGRMSDFTMADKLSMYKAGVGKEVELKRRIGDVSKIMKPILKDLRKAMEGDEVVTKELKSLQNRLSQVKNISIDSFSELMSDVRNVVIKTEGTGKMTAKLGEGQRLLHSKIANYIKKQPELAQALSKGVANAAIDVDMLYPKFIRTTEGKELTRAFNEGKMQGFDSPFDFWNRTVADEGYLKVSKLDDVGDVTIDEYKDAQRKLMKQTGREYTNLSKKIKLTESQRNDLLSKIVDNEQLLSDMSFKKDELKEQLLDVQSKRLKGKFINRHVAEMVESLTSTEKEVGQALVQRFKKANVVWNPAAIVRNAVSAQIQNWWELGIGPWDVKSYSNAIKIINEGIHNPVYKEMVEHGFARGQGGLQEVVSQAFNERAAAQAGVVTGKDGKHVLKKIGTLLEHAYGYPDDVAKIAAYTAGRAKGLDPETALRMAYSATFNYSDVTPLVRKMRTAIWGVPFLTFAIKSAPLVASTAIHARHRITVFQKIKEGMYNMAGVEGEDEREGLPAYMKDGVFIKMPFKNEDGSSAYFDMSYIIPFGALMDGGWVKDPVSANIVAQFVREMSTNKTFSGHTIFKEGAPLYENISMLSIQVTQRFIPKYLQTEIGIDGYNSDGSLRVNGLGGALKNNYLTEKEYQSYEFGNLMAKNLAIKFQKLDQETAASRQEWSKKEAISKVLTDNGVLKEYTKAYIPKEKEAGLGGQPIYDRDAKPIGR